MPLHQSIDFHNSLKRNFFSITFSSFPDLSSSSWSPSSPWSRCPSALPPSLARQIPRSQTQKVGREVARLWKSPWTALLRPPAASTRTETTSTRQSGPGPGGIAVSNKLLKFELYIFWFRQGLSARNPVWVLDLQTRREEMLPPEKLLQERQSPGLPEWRPVLPWIWWRIMSPEKCLNTW